jgi:hypothetical protein
MDLHYDKANEGDEAFKASEAEVWACRTVE